MPPEPLVLSAVLVPGAPAATGNVTIRLRDDLVPISVTVPTEPTTLEPPPVNNGPSLVKAVFDILAKLSDA